MFAEYECMNAPTAGVLPACPPPSYQCTADHVCPGAQATVATVAWWPGGRLAVWPASSDPGIGGLVAATRCQVADILSSG